MNQSKLLKILRKQKTIISIGITADRVVLLDLLVEQGEFKSRSQAIIKAIDELLKRYFPAEEKLEDVLSEAEVTA